VLSASVLVNLHNENPEDAWKSLLALTRFSTAWKTEPAAASHLIRFVIADLAQAAAWETLQHRGWTDEQLGALQHEWDSAEFLRGLPETVALSRVIETAQCRVEREAPVCDLGTFIHELIQSPDTAWLQLRGLFITWRFRHYDSYAREIGILVSYRDYESKIADAIKLPTWSAMLAGGITNSIPVPPGGIFAGGPGGPGGLAATAATGDMRRNLLGRAVEMEATRRVTIVAIALERYRLLHGTYPETLADLAPRFLKSVPLDFIDGKPLRYQHLGEGQFVLYSPGVDCRDNGGVLKKLIRDPSFRSSGVDLVWPRAATASELENFNEALDISRRLRKGEDVNIPESFQVPPYLRREFRTLAPSVAPE